MIYKSLKIMGSGAIDSKILNLGVLKISLCAVLSYFYKLWEALTLRGPILIHFSTIRGKANLYLTEHDLT